MTDSSIVPVGDHHSITDLDPAVTFTTPGRSRGIYVQAITQNVRLKIGGGAADTDDGFQIRADDPPLFISVKPGTSVSVIEETATAEFQWQAAERWDWL